MTQAFEVTIDHHHGGRWTSMTDPHGFEWLWHRSAPGRDLVQPGDVFVDVGGLEECYPTIGGLPDHGDIWSRSWKSAGAGWWFVESGEATFRRRVCVRDEVVVDYRLDAPPGHRFLWCGHLSLIPLEGLTIDAPTDHPVRAWPGHVRPVETTWPNVLDINGYHQLGQDDGSAMFCLLPGLDELTVRVDDRQLRLSVDCDDRPVGFGLWRNLGGYPWDGPSYRNFVVEPMLGQTLTLEAAHPTDCATVPETGVLTWQLRIRN